MSVRIISRLDRCESREPTNTMLLGTLFGAGFSWPLADFTPPAIRSVNTESHGVSDDKPEPSDWPVIAPMEPAFSEAHPARFVATGGQASAQPDCLATIDAFGDFLSEPAAVNQSAPLPAQPNAPPPGAGELPARIGPPPRPFTPSAAVDPAPPAMTTAPRSQPNAAASAGAAASSSSKTMEPPGKPDSNGGGGPLSGLDGCDCEPIPLVRLEAVDPTGSAWKRHGGSAHGTSTGAFEVRRTGDISGSLTVWYSVSEASTAVPGSDYEPLDGTVQIPAGQRSAGILVNPIDNANENAVRTVIISLDWSPDYLSSDDVATVSINESINEDLGNIHGVWRVPTVQIEGVDGNSAELLDQPSTGLWLVSRVSFIVVGPQQNAEMPPDTYTNTNPVTVNYSVSQPPAQVSGDYESLPGSVSLPGGVFAASVPLMPIDDLLVEGDEPVTIELTPSTSYNIEPGGGIGTVTIKDNDRTNQPPIANDDPNLYGAYEVTWNSTPELIHRLELEDPGVLVNDGDLDGDPVYVNSATTPDHAAEFEWCACGGFVYVPEEGFVGTDTFTYTISDGIAEASADVTIDVVDHAPVAADDYFWGLQGEPIQADAPGVLQNDSDPDEDPLTAELASSPIYGTLEYFNSDGSFRYVPNGSFTGTDWFTYYADDGYLQALATVFLTIDGNPDGVTGDLDIIKFDGSELADEKEQSPGGFVVLNNDNDNYQFNGNAQVLDKDKAGPIRGEHDLVPLRLHEIQPNSAGGRYRLVFNNADIRIWRTSDKQNEINSDSAQTDFDATQTIDVYVEGIARSPGGAAENVKLKWYKNPNDSGKVLDEVNLTVYEVTGAMNVPGYSAYNYKAVVPGRGLSPNWSATYGTVLAGATDHFSQDILWEGGPIVGKAEFTPVQNLGFKSERFVNIVAVDFENSPVTNKIFYDVNPPYQFPVGSNRIYSAPGQAMTANLKITRLEGPLVDVGLLILA